MFPVSPITPPHPTHTHTHTQWGGSEAFFYTCRMTSFRSLSLLTNVEMPWALSLLKIILISSLMGESISFQTQMFFVVFSATQQQLPYCERESRLGN